MRRYLILASGWLLVVIGLIVTPMPVPIPLIGVLPLLLGCAILTSHSKMFRRQMQAARHRFEWLSRRLEYFIDRGPKAVRHMVHRTNPRAHIRLHRMRARRKH
jgi:hypothetical protein